MPRSNSRCWKPFPVDALPEPARTFVVQASASLGCNPALVALPALATMAAAIGNAYVIRLKHDWIEVSVIWPVVVSESGTQKTPAIAMAIAPLVRRQEAALAGAKENEAGAKFGVPIEFHANEGPRAVGAATAPPPDLELGEPERLVVDDITIEGLALRLKSAPYGLLLVSDELATWLRSATRGANAARWLKVYGAGTIDVDRKTKNEWTHIPRAAVSIAGGIQPGVMRDLLAPRHFELGLVPRLLLAHPPRSRRKWTTATVAPAVLAAYDNLIGRLLGLRPRSPGGCVLPPVEVGLRKDAEDAWLEFFNRHADRQYAATGDEAAMLSKIEGVAARLALVLYCARSVGDEAATLDVRVDAESVRAGIELAEWFADESERTYDEFRQSPEEQHRVELVEWIERHGGRVTVRDVQLGPRRLRASVRLAELALQDLVDAGLGVWEAVGPSPRGGQRTVDFVLATATEPSETGSETEVVSPSPPEDIADGPSASSS